MIERQQKMRTTCEAHRKGKLKLANEMFAAMGITLTLTDARDEQAAIGMADYFTRIMFRERAKDHEKGA